MHQWGDFARIVSITQLAGLATVHVARITWVFILSAEAQLAMAALHAARRNKRSLCRWNEGSKTIASQDWFSRPRDMSGDQAQSYDIALFTQVEELGYQIRSLFGIRRFKPTAPAPFRNKALVPWSISE